MRQADAAAIDSGCPAFTLMTAAGTALARWVMTLATLRQTQTIIFLAGSGNNGGDACIAARGLHYASYHVQVILTATPQQMNAVAQQAYASMRRAGVPHTIITEPTRWQSELSNACDSLLCGGIIVDGLLGTGFHGAPRGIVKTAINWINHMRLYALIIAVDLPSGLNGDSGVAPDCVVQADVTITFARPKNCFRNDDQAHLSGHLLVTDIGLADAFCQSSTPDTLELIALPELQRHFPARAWDTHKGRQGHLAIIGGSAHLAHAPVLTALGATRSGAGLITLLTPSESRAAAAHWTPEVMLHALPTLNGHLHPTTLMPHLHALKNVDILILGPGLGTSAATLELVAEILHTYPGKVVLDADALTALAHLKAQGHWHPQPRPLILTPHVGEAARLLHTTTTAIQAERYQSVQRLAAAYQAVVVLKGTGTLVCAPDETPWLNRTGNPGMACGGMGDVLAGMIGALWAQGHTALQAATTAVWAHGTAGDFAAFQTSRTALSPTLLSQQLGYVYQKLEQ